ncbi:unnamed protein product [Ixodes persulcatus]
MTRKSAEPRVPGRLLRLFRTVFYVPSGPATRYSFGLRTTENAPLRLKPLCHASHFERWEPSYPRTCEKRRSPKTRAAITAKTSYKRRAANTLGFLAHMTVTRAMQTLSRHIQSIHA